jgi:SAM-dependent methyltransferase
MAHESAYRHYRNFLEQRGNPGDLILDVGGEGGKFKEIAEELGMVYHDLNRTDSAIVNVNGREYDWPAHKDYYDLVVSSSTFEHIPMFWLTFKEMVRVLAPGGFIYLNAPSSGPNHWDWDGWRFRKDSMQALADWGQVKLIDSFEDDLVGCDPTWHDTVGIFQKK